MSRPSVPTVGEEEQEEEDVTLDVNSMANNPALMGMVQGAGLVFLFPSLFLVIGIIIMNAQNSTAQYSYSKMISSNDT